MLADRSCGHGILEPPVPRADPATGIVLYVNDVDDAFKRAIEAGAKTQQLGEIIGPRFYGDSAQAR